MAGYIEDRWLNKRPDKETGKRERTTRYGKGKRYRVGGIPGVRDASFDTLRDAQAWKATAETDSRRMTWLDPRSGEITLLEYVEEHWWPARNDPVNTATTMRNKIWNHILAHLGGLQLRQIDKDAIRKWLREVRGKGTVGESTLEVLWVYLSSILGSAVGTRIAANPCTLAQDLRPSPQGDTKARAWAVDEVLAVREGLTPRYRITADLGVSAGMRQAEMIGFSADDIDEQRMLIHMRRQLLWENGTHPYFKLPKGKKEREIPLSPGLLTAIREHEARFEPPSVTLPWQGPGNGGRSTATVRLLVTTAYSMRINPSTYNRKTLKPALACAGLIPPFDDDNGWEPSRGEMYHRFRHTYASVQLAHREDPISVSKWMGHSSPEITLRIYAHFMPDDGARGRSAVDAWLSAASR